MVADRIDVISRRAGADDVWIWRSSGEAGFDLLPADEGQAAAVVRGTQVVLAKEGDKANSAGAVDEAVILAAVKSALEGRVADVRASKRLTDSPSCLVSA